MSSPAAYPSLQGSPAVQPSRIITGLRMARALAERPSCIPISRPRGAKAAGLRFEKALARSLRGCYHGTWFEYEDAAGFGYCQPDIIVSFLPSFLAVIEVKYTLVPGAHSKLSGLYIPVVEEAFGASAAGVVVVKNLDPRFRRGRIFTNLPDAAYAALETGYPTLVQWSGQSLMPPPGKEAVPRSGVPSASPATPLSPAAYRSCV